MRGSGYPTQCQPQNPTPCDFKAYKGRNRFERMLNRLKQLRRITLRFDKTTKSFAAFLAFAAASIWMPHFVNRTKFNSRVAVCASYRHRQVEPNNPRKDAAEQIIDLLRGGGPPPRLLNPEAWPLYAERYRRILGAEPGEIHIGGPRSGPDFCVRGHAASAGPVRQRTIRP